MKAAAGWFKEKEKDALVSSRGWWRILFMMIRRTRTETRRGKQNWKKRGLEVLFLSEQRKKQNKKGQKFTLHFLSLVVLAAAHRHSTVLPLVLCQRHSNLLSSSVLDSTGPGLVARNKPLPERVRRPELPHLLDGDTTRLRNQEEDKRGHDGDPSGEEQEDTPAEGTQQRDEDLAHQRGEEKVDRDVDRLADRARLEGLDLCRDEPAEGTPREGERRDVDAWEFHVFEGRERERRREKKGVSLTPERTKRRRKKNKKSQKQTHRRRR